VGTDVGALVSSAAAVVAMESELSLLTESALDDSLSLSSDESLPSLSSEAVDSSPSESFVVDTAGSVVRALLSSSSAIIAV